MADGGRSGKVAVGSFATYGEAAVVRSRLEAEGIAATIPAETSRFVATKNGYSVYVSRRDRERAAALVQVGEDFVDLDEYVDSDDTSYPRCPECGSVCIVCAPLPLGRWLGAIVLAGVPLLFVRRAWSCRKCGREWTRRFVSR